MGISWNITFGVDFMLFLYMEGCKMDWKSCIFYRSISVFSFNNFTYPWYNITWRY